MLIKNRKRERASGSIAIDISPPLTTLLYHVIVFRRSNYMTIKRNISVKSKKDFGFREFTFWVVRHQQAIADRLGIHITDFKCLGVLHRKGAMTPKTLATEMAVSTAAMT